MENGRRSAVRRGQRWPGRYLWRATLLFLEGLLHYLLIFEWDVLMGYALTSVLVAFLVGRSARVQRVWMIVHAAILGLIVALATFALMLPSGASEGSGASGDPGGTGEPLDLYRDGGWLEQVVFRIDNWPLFRIETVLIIPLGVTLFLAGIRLTRAGVCAAKSEACPVAAGPLTMFTSDAYNRPP